MVRKIYVLIYIVWCDGKTFCCIDDYAVNLDRMKVLHLYKRAKLAYEIMDKFNSIGTI